MTQTRRGVLLSSLWAITADHLGTVRVAGGCLVSKSCQTLVNPWTVARQALLSMGFSRQEYGVGSHSFHALEKEMAAHSSVLAWRIPGTAEPRGLPSMGSHRVGHN